MLTVPVLMIDEPTRQAIAKAIDEATANTTSFAEYKRQAIVVANFGLMSRPKCASVVIPEGHKATIAIVEVQEGRPFRHLAMSSPGEGPQRVFVQMVMRAFGFKRQLEQCTLWATDLGPGRYAVNVLEPCDDAEWNDTPATAAR